MIWFDAALEEPVSAEALRRSLSTMLDTGYDGVSVIDDIAQTRFEDPVTCLTDLRPRGSFSQVISIYQEPMPTSLSILDGASRLAQLLQVRMLIANDETVDPYSFILVSKAGATAAVQIDMEALDQHDRYVIVEP
ncbi:hypothetical protein [Lysobacter sp. CA199]|uniref:hypothetical protein n=1 Tax=Lysobacter sp. CA199 TaxID=3455608 RepID=UPI003F8D028A